MCAINPTHKKRLILDVYTSEQGLTREQFLNRVLDKALVMEQELNSTTKLRWHLKESPEEAD